MAEKITKTETAWQSQLSAEEYRVTREQSTEPAFTGKYYAHKAIGTYHCICCDTALFRSSEKFDSGTGWPSFWDVCSSEAIDKHTDTNHNMVRTEVRCATCDAHLGHSFPDGPPPTGERYCINSAALAFKPASEDQ